MSLNNDTHKLLQEVCNQKDEMQKDNLDFLKNILNILDKVIIDLLYDNSNKAYYNLGAVIQGISCFIENEEKELEEKEKIKEQSFNE